MIVSKVNVDVYSGDSKYYPSQQHSFKWDYRLVERSSVGVNIAAQILDNGELDLEYEVETEDDTETKTHKVNLQDFEEEIEYQSLSENNLGLGLHLEEVEIDLKRKVVKYKFATNNF